MTAANARASVYEGKERGASRLKNDAEWFKEYVNDEIDNYHQGTRSRRTQRCWASGPEYVNKPDLASQGALAVSYVASKGIKRLDQASQNARRPRRSSQDEAERGAHGAQHQAAARLRRRAQDHGGAAKGLETPQELSRRAHAGEAEFSKIPGHRPTCPRGRHHHALAGRDGQGEASKAATGGAAAKANLEGDLMETLLACPTGGLRYTHSNTNHAWVGTPSASADLSVLRAAPKF